jgi:sulfonate transport system substrate-binding protein
LRRATGSVLSLLIPALIVAGCSSSSKKPAASSAAAPAASAGAGAASAIPAGTVLRVGDQQKSLQTEFAASGALAGAPYKVEFDQFASGPLVDAAFAAKQIDVGTMGDTPASATVSGGLGLKAVAISHAVGPTLTLLAKPGITSITQLKGKKVAFTTGTAQQAAVLRALASVGMKQSDVEQVNVTLLQLGTVLQSGNADASIVGAADTIKYEAAHPNAGVLATNDKLDPPSYGYILATPSALSSPGVSAAVFDFVGRLNKAAIWVKTHQSDWIDAYYVKVQHQDPTLAKKLIGFGGTTDYVPQSPAVQQAEQKMVDLLAQAGAIKASFDVGPLYDPAVAAKYNAIVAGNGAGQ